MQHVVQLFTVCVLLTLVARGQAGRASEDGDRQHKNTVHDEDGLASEFGSVHLSEARTDRLKGCCRELAEKARASTDERRTRTLIRALSKMVLLDDHVAAEYAWLELRTMARQKARYSQIAADAIEQLDERARKWIGSLGDDHVASGEFPAIRGITIKGPEVNPADLKLLRVCRWLDNDWEFGFGSSLSLIGLHGTNISDADLTHLAGLRAVTVLELGNTRVTGEGLKCLAMPQLKIVHLERCPVTDETVQKICVPSLTFLDLADTKVGDDGLRRMHVGGIQELTLYGTRVSPEGVAGLARFSCLSRVRLDAHILNGPGISHLTTCKSVREVLLKGRNAEEVAEKVRSELPGHDVRVEKNGDDEIEIHHETP